MDSFYSIFEEIQNVYAGLFFATLICGASFISASLFQMNLVSRDFSFHLNKILSILCFVGDPSFGYLFLCTCQCGVAQRNKCICIFIFIL